MLLYAGSDESVMNVYHILHATIPSSFPARRVDSNTPAKQLNTVYKYIAVRIHPDKLKYAKAALAFQTLGKDSTYEYAV